MMTEGDLTLGVDHTRQYTDDILLNFTLKTNIILLDNVNPINLIKIVFMFQLTSSTLVDGI